MSLTKRIIASSGLMALLCTAACAYAECTYEGETFQTGETFGPLICMPDGTWQPE